MNIGFTLNGRTVRVEVGPSERLLDVLRERLGLTGTKEGCGEGECGACSIIMNGMLVNSCLIPAFQADNSKIETIEGVVETAIGKAIVDSFAECGAVQCGFCTPGFVVAGAALFRENPDPTEEDVRVALSGNLCRCTGYSKLVEGVLIAARKLKERK